MSGIDELTKAAAAAAVGALTKGAMESALSVGRKVWDWLMARAAPVDKPALAAVEAVPADPDAPERVALALKVVLRANPAAARELEELLGGASGAFAVRQTAHVTGNHNFTPQISGSGNLVVGGHSLGIAPGQPWPRG